MVRIEGVFFMDKGIRVLDKEVLNSKHEHCGCEKYFEVMEENERLKAELAACVKVYEEAEKQKEVIRILRKRILVLASQNRVYAESIER